MIVSSAQLSDLWDVIRDEIAQSSEKSITVLHSVSEVDSACAARLLMRFLRTGATKFSFYPVNDFRDLKATMHDTLQGSEEMRTVFMINCGATSFVRQLLEEDGINAANVRFVVVDSHRPVDIRYNNPSDTDNLLLLDDDDPMGPGDVPPYSELDDLTEEEYQQLVEEAEGGGSGSEDSGSDDEGGRAKRQKSHGEASPSGGGGSGGARRQRQEARRRLEAVNARKELLEDYYTCGSCYGKPAAIIMLELVHQLTAGLEAADLWPAMVGLADQHVHQRASKHHYDQWCRQLKDKLEATPGQPDTYVDEDGATRARPSYVATIASAPDFRLFLHRHWSLYDALRYSPYVAPRMQTWREGGLTRMGMLFVNMGLKLEQARTPAWIRTPGFALADKLPQACRNTVLAAAELQFESFELRYGYNFSVSAADAVHALTGILCRHMRAGGGRGGGSGGGGAQQQAQQQLDSPGRVRAAQQEESHADFWDALSALAVSTPQAYSLLKQGIEEAKALQTAVIKDGGLMITRRQLEANPAHHMQELNLQAIRPINAERFRHPLALLRLATFVRDAADVARTGRKPKWPMAVVGPDDGSGYCCVMGIRNKQLPKQPQFNVFGLMFQQVLQEEADVIKWDAGRDGFDAAVVYVHRESVPTFMAELRIRLGQQAAAAGKADAAARAAAAAAAGEGEASAGGGGGGGGRDQRRRRAGGGGGGASAEGSPAGDRKQRVRRRGGGSDGSALGSGEGELDVDVGGNDQ